VCQLKNGNSKPNSRFHNLIRVSSAEEFDQEVSDICQKFPKVAKYISKLAEEKDSWCPLFTKDSFNAGIQSTQRAEAINSVRTRFPNLQ